MENAVVGEDKLGVIMHQAKHAPPGLFAEAGVYKGGVVKLLALTHPERTVVGFDTFTGLPESHWKPTEIHEPKDFSDTSLEAVTQFINLPNVQLVPGIFPQSAEAYTDAQFALVHVDLDYYLSTKAALDWFWPRLVHGGCMIFDDYEWYKCPGVKKALDEFCKPYSETVRYQVVLKKN